MNIEILHRPTTIEEYIFLTHSVGWEQYVSEQTAAIALANSLFCVVACNDSETIGTGRIIGDGALFFYIQDVIVHPSAQGLGIGGKIMSELMDWVQLHAPTGATIGLFAADGKGPFYEKYGFEARTNDRPGMTMEIKV